MLNRRRKRLAQKNIPEKEKSICIHNICQVGPFFPRKRCHRQRKCSTVFYLNTKSDTLFKNHEIHVIRDVLFAWTKHGDGQLFAFVAVFFFIFFQDFLRMFSPLLHLKSTRYHALFERNEEGLRLMLICLIGKFCWCWLLFCSYS